MKFTSFGCSFVFGTDLPDQTDLEKWPRFSHLTWPSLVSRNLEINYWSRSQGGIGNLCILNRVLDAIYLSPEDFFIISWTFIDRFDYSHPSGAHFGNGLDDYLTLLPSDDSNKNSEHYFKHLHSEHKDKFINLMYIKTAVDFLKNYKIPFVMTCVDDTLFCQKWHAPPYVVRLQDQIRPYMYNFEGRNFVDWSRHKGFDISPTGHPLCEAHAAAAEIMTPIIDAILRKA
jgi:hypothetical protein